MKTFRAWAALLALSLTLVPLLSQAQAPQPPEIAAKSYILMDLTSNQVLAEHEADAPADPESPAEIPSEPRPKFHDVAPTRP